MTLSASTIRDLEALARSAREIGEDEVTVPFQDGTVTFRFVARPAPLTAGAQMVARRAVAALRRHTLLFPGLRP